MLCSIASSESDYYVYIRGKSSPSDWVCRVPCLVQIFGEKHWKPPAGASLKIFMKFLKTPTEMCMNLWVATLNDTKTTANENLHCYFGKVLLKLSVFLYILMT